jgi:predicted nucleic acid-binding protein
LSYLIDTCAISELVRPRPDPLVIRWFEMVPQTALYLSALALGEIRKGVEKLPEVPRRARTAAWLEIELPAWFDDRILPIGPAVADEWGRLVARAGRTLPAIDGLIAATALHHRLAIVTRNIADFSGLGIDIVDPWQS